MLKFYYNPAYKYTNRTIINLTNDSNFKEIDYENIDSPDTINGHVIYKLTTGENIPTYILDTNSSWRWYVSGITQLRTGKFQISLLRDVISEGDNWKGEEAYIEAGTATDYCRYKKWGLPFTNTKVGEQRLEINGKSSFFVYYVNEQHINSNAISESDLKVEYSTLPGINQVDYDLNSLDEIDNIIYAQNNMTVRYISEYYARMLVKSTEDPNYKKAVEVNYDSYDSFYPLFVYDSVYPNINNYMNSYSAIVYYLLNPNEDNYAIYNAFRTSVRGFTRNYVPTIPLVNKQPKSSIDALKEYVGKTIRVPHSGTPGTYDFYTISCSENVHPATTTLEVSKANTNGLYYSLLDSIPSGNLYPVGDHYYEISYGETAVTFNLIPLGTGTSFDFTFKANTRKLSKSSVRCVNIVSDEDVSDEDIANCLMLSMANPNNENQLSRIVDVQFLPFQIATTNTNSTFRIGAHDLISCSIETDDVLYTKELSSLTNINKETDSVVIVSPSRKSQFKFSPYNNDGRMVFDFKATLRPNQCVMYVRPSTQGLLMRDWDDKECLIIQEDFSLTKMDSAWTEYVYNNRNYQNAFNLSIQTKDFERSWERKIEQAQAKSDEWTARNISADKGRVYGLNLPILGDITAAVGTAFVDKNYMEAANLDRQYNEAMYQRGLEVARTEFQYQIDNIKSQPLIPNTITAIDAKLLDGIYLEFYSTNETEKASIESFYYHNGNRIDNYGTFNQYYGSFVRGKIIRSNTYTQPEIDEINRRLEMGIYTS